MRRREVGPLLGLTTVLLITVLWWALALWPLSEAAPEWWARTRAVCFGAAPGGLPDASGWVALVLQPMVMILVLVFFWGEEIAVGIRGLRASLAGRVVLSLAVASLGVGALAAAGRVVGVAAGAAAATAPEGAPAPSYPRLDRSAPELELVDQHGEEFRIAALRGRIAFVTFAFAHCETVCPLVVQNAIQAKAASGPVDPVVVVVTLDPWRDVPARLSHIAERWALPPDGYVLSGEVEEVNATLDAWNVARRRDLRTGDLTHPALVYVVDRAGNLAYATRGEPDVLASLAGSL